MRWLRYDDTCSKVFFDFHLIGKKKTLLKELKVDGRTISKQKDFSHYFSQFYANLYTSELHSLGIVKAQKKCLESLPSRITEDTNAEMT